jgi:hypothetical protein
MSAKREDLAKTIVREYHSNGIPAKVYRGMVLVHREGELAGPFPAEDVALEFRAEIESVKKLVLAKLETYGITEILKKFKNGRVSLFNLLVLNDEQSNKFFFKNDDDLVRRAQGIHDDADFLAKPFYWDVARVLVLELAAEEGRAGDPPG